MRFADVLRFALSALNQQRGRTLLTTLGVVIGSFVLIVSLSIGQGFHAAVVREFRKQGELRTIIVMPGYKTNVNDIPAEKLEVKGRMSEAKRERIRQRLIWRWSGLYGRRSETRLTLDRLIDLAAIDHVEKVIPNITLYNASATFGGRSERVLVSALPSDDDILSRHLVDGTIFSASDSRSVLVSEYLLHLWGIVNDEDVPAVIGKKLLLEYRSGASPGYLLQYFNANTLDVKPEEEKLLQSIVQQLPQLLEKLDLPAVDKEELRKLIQRRALPATTPKDALISEEFTIAGVFRNPRDSEESFPGWDRWLSSNVDMVLPLKAGEELMARLPHFRDVGYQRVSVVVDDEENIRPVIKAIAAIGLDHHSLAEFADQIRFNVLLISFVTTFIAAVALVVAALGITNTMLMSVLERTHEIGVMKAVGARNRHIQLIFLLEGALLGAAGGVFGFLLSWVVAFPGDAVARSFVEKQAQLKLEESLFVFPPWLSIGVPLFAMLVTTIAAAYPAWRAARVNPVESLRHE